MGENGGRTTGQLLSHGPCACLAWCFMSLAHIQRAGTAGLAVSDDGDGRVAEKIRFYRAKLVALTPTMFNTKTLNYGCPVHSQWWGVRPYKQFCPALRS